MKQFFPVPVLNESSPERVADSRNESAASHRELAVSASGEARESNDAANHSDRWLDSRGGENTLSGGVSAPMEERRIGELRQNNERLAGLNLSAGGDPVPAQNF